MTGENTARYPSQRRQTFGHLTMTISSISHSHLTSATRLEHSINSLLGLLEGIAIDGLINDAEIAFLADWCQSHSGVQQLHPFNELVPAVLDAIQNGAISAEEKRDLKWLCERLKAKDFFSGIAADIQRLRSIIDGIQADKIINENELKGLSDWLDEHSHLRRSWPYEELMSIVTCILADRKIEQTELGLLRNFLRDISASGMDSAPDTATTKVAPTITGICAMCPEILFEEKTFCLSGKFSHFSPQEITSRIAAAGGKVQDSVDEYVNYLVVGSDANPCWAYACYGRSVEHAVRLRQAGYPLLLIHENDLLDALSNL